MVPIVLLPLLLLVTALPAQAHHDSSRTAIGAGLGAAVGAALGNELGGRDEAIVGGAIGGAVGAAVARDRYGYRHRVDRHDRWRGHRGVRRHRGYRDFPVYRQDRAFGPPRGYRDRGWRQGRRFAHDRRGPRHCPPRPTGPGPWW